MDNLSAEQAIARLKQDLGSNVLIDDSGIVAGENLLRTSRNLVARTLDPSGNHPEAIDAEPDYKALIVLADQILNLAS